MSLSETKLLMLRNLRNELLQESDWVVIKAQETNTSVPSDWITYRQKLRDITKTYKSIHDEGFAFPAKPTDTD
tara:strand:+ start:1786 stop:2004 length:219 start_codon:yes stop_codon:yes gene_type:complete